MSRHADHRATAGAQAAWLAGLLTLPSRES